MKKLTKVLALLLALCMIFGLVACAKDEAPAGGDTPASDANAPAADGGEKDTTVTVGTTAATGYFNPNGSSAGGDNYVSYMIYNQLFDIDPVTGEWISPISDDWGWEDDLTLKITVKDGITYDGGGEMDAHDILATMQYNIDSNNQRAGMWMGVIDFDNTTVSEDGKTITIKYLKVYGGALTELTMSILDDEFLAAHPDGDEIWWNKPVGSGPYRIKEVVTDSYVTYELREDYWDTSETFDCTEITVKYYSDANSLWAEYTNGEVDAVLGLTDTQVAALQADSSLGTLVLKPINGVPCMSLNEHTEALQDPAVREAIGYAVPWFEVGQIAWGTLAKEASSHYSTTLACYTDHSGYYTYDPDKAIEILTEAGYAPGDIVLSYVAVNETQQVRVMEAVQGYLDAVGITIETAAVELPVALAENYFVGANDMAIVTTNGANYTREPWQFLSPLTNGLFQDRSISDPEYVALAEACNATTDNAARMEVFKQIDTWLYENNWMFPYCEVMEAWCFNSRIAEFDMLNNWYDCLGNIKLA